MRIHRIWALPKISNIEKLVFVPTEANIPIVEAGRTVP